MTNAEKAVRFTAKKIAALENMKDQSGQKALLAELRRGVGRKPGDIPQLWGSLLRELPEELMSRNGEPTEAEWAIYTALTLYAYHQQGKDPGAESMNVPGRGLGQAVAMLAENDDDLKRIQTRFNRFATAADMPEAVTHLRGLVGILRAKGIGFDYPRLAGELYSYQFYEGAQRVRLCWGQDFYKNLKNNEEDSNNE